MNYLQQHLNLNQSVNLEPWNPPARKRLELKVKGLRLRLDPSLEEKANDVAKALDAVFILHEQAKTILDKGIELILRCGTTTTPGGGFITAPSQAGKSAICHKLLQQFPRVSQDGVEQVPVLFIRCGSGVNAKNLATVMLRALHYPFSKGMDANALAELLARALNAHGVRLIIIDEANHISEGGRQAMAKNIGNALKMVYQNSGVPMLVFGTEALINLIEIGDELANRLTARYQIGKFKFGNEFRDVLNTFGKALPIASEVDLDDLELAYAIFLATAGIIGHIKELLKDALRMAVRAKRSKITRQDFVAAFVSRYGPDKENPFLVSHDDVVSKFRAKRSK